MSKIVDGIAKDLKLVTEFSPKRFADRSRVRHCTPPCGVFQSQGVPAWQGVWFFEVGNRKGY